MMLSLWACAADVPPPPAEPPAPPPPVVDPDMPTVPTLLGDAPGIHFVGDWTSKGCEGRTYPRNVRFESDHTWVAVDMVSPCPVGTQCSWSGLVTFGGTWQIEGTELRTREVGGTASPGGPHPTKFEATKDKKLIENGCFYEAGLTIPDGYDAERVTPRAPT